MRQIGWILWTLLAVLVLLFAVVNRAPVVLSFWPLPLGEIQAPLSFVMLGALLLGFLLGALVMYLAGAETRRALRNARRALQARGGPADDDLTKLPPF